MWTKKVVNTDILCNKCNLWNFIDRCYCETIMIRGIYSNTVLCMVSTKKVIFDQVQIPMKSSYVNFRLYVSSLVLLLPSLVLAQCISWSYKGKSINKLNRIINGNGKKGYNIGLWNCRKGLIDSDKSESTKMTEIKQFLSDKCLHLLCVIESDLHGPGSRYSKRIHLSDTDVQSVLKIPGYQLIFPKSWSIHGQARIIVYAKQELIVKTLDIGSQNSDLPIVNLEIGLGKEKRTIVSFFYREFTSGVSGLNDMQSQVERLARQIKIWKSLCHRTKDFISLGDANICAIKWLDEDYQFSDLGNMVQEFLLETACSQLVKQYTRSEVVRGGRVAKSCIDHCYTNVPDKVSDPEVVMV